MKLFNLLKKYKGSSKLAPVATGVKASFSGNLDCDCVDCGDSADCSNCDSPGTTHKK